MIYVQKIVKIFIKIYDLLTWNKNILIEKGERSLRASSFLFKKVEQCVKWIRHNAWQL